MDLSNLSGCRLLHGIPPKQLPTLLGHAARLSKALCQGPADLPHGGYGACAVRGAVRQRNHRARRRLGATGTILDRIPPGAVFAETYACIPGTPMMVSAVAAEPSEVLFLPAERLLAPAQGAAHAVLLRNLLDVTVRKKPDPDAQNITTRRPNTLRGRAAVLPVRAGGAVRQRCVRHPVPTGSSWRIT